MTIRVFLNDKIFDLPKIQPSNQDFKKGLANHLKQFINKLKEVQLQSDWFDDLPNYPISLIITRLTRLVAKINNSLEFYYNGKPSEAYKSLESGLESEQKDFTEVLNIKVFQAEESFYRIRIHAGNQPLGIADFFHIPFEKRGLVKTQRFSIPGFPSLYLGTSIYVCWEELNRPNVNDFQGVRLKNTNILRVIDLSPPSKETTDPMIFINI